MDAMVVAMDEQTTVHYLDRFNSPVSYTGRWSRVDGGIVTAERVFHQMFIPYGRILLIEQNIFDSEGYDPREVQIKNLSNRLRSN